MGGRKQWERTATMSTTTKKRDWINLYKEVYITQRTQRISLNQGINYRPKFNFSNKLYLSLYRVFRNSPSAWVDHDKSLASSFVYSVINISCIFKLRSWAIKFKQSFLLHYNWNNVKYCYQESLELIIFSYRASQAWLLSDHQNMNTWARTRDRAGIHFPREDLRNFFISWREPPKTQKCSKDKNRDRAKDAPCGEGGKRCPSKNPSLMKFPQACCPGSLSTPQCS